MSEPAFPTVTILKFLQGYKFIVDFGMEGVPKLQVDESKPTGDGSGPNPERLLSASVGHCLSSSLFFCLNKSRVKINGLQTTVKANIVRNEEGRLRIKNLDVLIKLDVDEQDKDRVPHCLEIFENYCTVTESVIKGLEVEVRTEYV